MLPSTAGAPPPLRGLSSYPAIVESCLCAQKLPLRRQREFRLRVLLLDFKISHALTKKGGHAAILQQEVSTQPCSRDPWPGGSCPVVWVLPRPLGRGS